MERNSITMRHLVRTLTMATLSFAALSPAPALAYFHVDESQNPDNMPHSCGASRMQQRGAGSAQTVNGHGTRVPLGQAIKVLAPSGWHVKATPEVSDFKISWASGASWTEALASGSPDTICFIVDWNNKWILASRDELDGPIEVRETGGQLIDGPAVALSEGAHVSEGAKDHGDSVGAGDTRKGHDYGPQKNVDDDQPADATDAAGADDESTAHDYGSQADNAEETKSGSGDSAVLASDKATPKPPAKAPPHVSFHLERGRRLSSAIRSFLSTYGWELAWSSSLDFPVDYSMDVDGKTVRDVLSQITQLYPLQLTLYNANRVVEVKSASSADTSIEGGRGNDAL